ncbi:FAD-binding oxidoreductase [Micrococcales bacterium 31B]|nr:FAD-binding oxidoreductase [Micrococcales bacterium 31B]
MPHEPSPLLTQLAAQLTEPERASERPLDLHALASDASHFALTPRAVVRAADATEVARILAACSAAGTPVTFRSGGTSLSGQAVTESVLVDVRRHFQAVEVLDEGARVRVEPGCVLARANARLAPHGRKIGPDPASESACTIGGVISNNSSGMACGVADNSYHTLHALRFVLPSGTVVDTALPDADARLRHDEPELHAGLARLRDRVRANPASVATLTAQFAMKNTMGYSLNALLDFDEPAQILAHLVVGAEGTLAFVASATFNTVPLRSHLATALAVFDSTAAATDALPGLVATGAATLELMDATSLRVGQRAPDAPALIRDLDVRRHAALLIEYRADDASGLDAYTADFAREANRLGLPRGVQLSADPRLRADLWHLRKGLYAMVAGARPTGTTALLEDVVVPVEKLSSTCDRLGAMFDRYGYEDCVIFGHAKDGNIHFMLTDRFVGDGLDRYAAFTEDMVDLVLAAGGSLKAEHGTGRVMAPYVRRQFGDELYDVMVQIKALCDPSGILNPGVILTEDATAHLKHIKAWPTVEPEVDRCVECGYCEPVCPSRNLTLTPRQRIVADRAMQRARAAGDTALLADLSRDYDYAGLDTCAVDGLCQSACPVSINTGDLVKRLRGEGRGPVERAAAKAVGTRWSAVGGVASLALSAATKLPAPLVTGPNALARRLLGAEVVPQWSADLPGGGASRARPQPQGVPDVVYLPACIGRMFGAAPGHDAVQDSFLALCERVGITAQVPEGIDALCCGTPAASKGYAEAARAMRELALTSLLRASLGGAVPVVCDASSCTEALVSAAGEAGPEGVPALRVIDVVQYTAEHVLPRLREHAPQSSATDARLDRLVLHPTCSSQKLGIAAHLREVAQAAAREVVIPDDWGCCAFAGDRGMLHPELTAAATAPEAAAIARLDAAAAPGAVGYASCSRTCEIGLSRATGAEYVHVITALEEATRPARV